MPGRTRASWSAQRQGGMGFPPAHCKSCAAQELAEGRPVGGCQGTPRLGQPQLFEPIECREILAVAVCGILPAILVVVGHASLDQRFHLRKQARTLGLLQGE